MPTALAVLWLLVSGWIGFLARVLPQVTPAPPAIATGVAALVLFTLGLQLLGRRTYASTRPNLPAAWPWRWTLSAVALTVLLFVSGLSVVGLVRSVQWLVEEIEVTSSCAAPSR